jgi:hypothetical protein
MYIYWISKNLNDRLDRGLIVVLLYLYLEFSRKYDHHGPSITVPSWICSLTINDGHGAVTVTVHALAPLQRQCAVSITAE